MLAAAITRAVRSAGTGQVPGGLTGAAGTAIWHAVRAGVALLRHRHRIEAMGMPAQAAAGVAMPGRPGHGVGAILVVRVAGAGAVPWPRRDAAEAGTEPWAKPHVRADLERLGYDNVRVWIGDGYRYHHPRLRAGQGGRRHCSGNSGAAGA